MSDPLEAVNARSRADELRARIKMDLYTIREDVQHLEARSHWSPSRIEHELMKLETRIRELRAEILK